MIALRLFGDRRNDRAVKARSCTGTGPFQPGAVSFDFRVPRSVGLAHRPEREDIPSPCGEIVSYISFFDKGHGALSRPVAYLQGARLERSMES